MSDRFQYDVFLSHNRRDKPRVRRLAERLRDAGLRVWLDDWVLRPGDDVYLAIEQGLEASRTLVLCMSPAAFRSDWVGLERSTVLFRDPTNQGRRFIPLLLADCRVPDTVRRFKHVDYRDQAEPAFQELLAACRAETERPPPAPEPWPGKEPEAAAPLALLERKLEGHKAWVKSVAVSREGKWAASGSRKGAVKIWDLETGACRATLKGHQDLVWDVAITPDGERVLAGAKDGTIRVWEVGTGRQLAVLKGHTRDVCSVVVMPDGARALSGSWDRTLKTWNVNTGDCLKTIKGSDADIFSVAVTTDGQSAVCGDRQGKLKIWDLETGKCLATLQGHADCVKSVQVTPDGRHVVSGSTDKTVKLWDLKTGSCLGTFEGHAVGLELHVAISSDGTLVASTGFTDNTLRLWDLQSGHCLQVLRTEGRESFISVAFSQDGSRLVAGTAGPPAVIYVYRLTALPAAPRAEPSRRYVNAKVVLLGKSGVGKSGLAHRLIEDRFVKTASTHGMQVWRLDLPIAKEDQTEREALLWDLAGQEDYRQIHQLFLDETALALVLIDPQQDDPFAEVGDWLKALDAAVTARGEGREAVKLLIAARTDVGTVRVSQHKIDCFLEEHGFAGYLPTSASTGENCSDRGNQGRPSALKQLIARQIPWNTLPWTATPRLLRELKDAVLAMTEDEEFRLLRFSELVQRLKQTLAGEKFGKDDVRTAVTLLANHGLVMPLAFGDLVLLQPQVLNGYAAAVIRAARAHTDEIGCVAEQDVFAREIDFAGVDRLAPADEKLLLRAMVQTFLDKSLCIAEPTPGGRQLIFPSQYRREPPLPAHPEIFVSYTFTGELATIYTTLVVRLWYSREFQRKQLWRNAAELTTSRGQVAGLLMDRTGEGVATLRVFFDPKVPDELKVVFIEYVHQHLQRYARDVHRDRCYVCRCGKPVTDREAVRERLKAGKRFIYCQRCDEKVPLIDHLEQRLTSDPVAREVERMDEVATQELDAQALEQILIGHIMAICGEANQIFRPVTMFDYGIDGEIELKNDHGQPSGRKIYVQLKSGDSHLRLRQRDRKLVFDVRKPRHLDYWLRQPVDVYLVIRDTEGTIRWMNLSAQLRTRSDKKSRQIVFEGEKLDAPAVWRLRDRYLRRPT